ncbi:MAG: hypothetical protein JW753_05605 [Dehalococcoidia bacterium]|nr:hypothetical protein [Dehalococcoidia bacterium]
MKTRVKPRIDEWAGEQRNQALQRVTAAIANILQPRGGFVTDSLFKEKHFMPIPGMPMGRPHKDGPKAGVPGAPDPKELEAYRETIVAVTQREKELHALAQQAKNRHKEMADWNTALTERETPFTLAQKCGALLPEDAPDVEAINREHARFLRVCDNWTQKLAF